MNCVGVFQMHSVYVGSNRELVNGITVALFRVDKPLGVGQGFETVQEMYGCLDNVAMVTLAPELENSCDAVEGLTDRGIVVSVGESGVL